MKNGYTIPGMKKFMWVLVPVLTIIFTPISQIRAEQNLRGLLIAEVQTGSATSASEEFVELYNASEQSISLNAYRLEYFPANVSDFSQPTRSIALSGVLAPEGRYLLGSTDYLENANTAFGATLAKAGGHLRIVRQEASGVGVDDVLGWGSSKLPETSAASAPESGKSIARKVVDNEIQDTNNNQIDFEASDLPSPKSEGVTNPLPPEEPEEPSEPTPEVPEESAEPEAPEPENPEPTPESPQSPVVLPIHITELLPNPGSPKTDTNDEFIEIYNPNTEPVDLEGYRIETGNEFRYSYIFGSRVIGAQQYIVLTSAETNLTLANGGGRARLLHTNGTVLSETMPYDTAKDDMAWAIIGSTWQWTSSPTPGQANLITSSKDEAAAAKLKKAATTKKTTKAASTKGAKTASTKASGKVNEEDAAADEEEKKLPMQPVILAGVGALALGYAAYEYRSDIANHLRKLRGLRKGGASSGE